MQDYQKTILSVTQLNLQAKQLLEQGLGVVQITGEISNWMRAGSGHCYFSLKDDQAQVRCACFRGSAMRLKFQPENGLAVVLTAQVSLYPNRGEYQLIVTTIEPAGLGQLALQFAKLKEKLQAEGLFADESKKSLPSLPKRIGIISSPTGAALQDMKKVLARRFPLIPITLYPSLVQGKEAAAELCCALKQAEQDNRCDVILLARGGGSMEDLWAFNDETLARLIASSTIPIVTGIGHEVDFTIADFTADLRAATPSAAAELVVPDQKEFFDLLATIRQTLINQIATTIERKTGLLRQLEAQLVHPKQLLQNQMQRLDYLQQQLLTRLQQLLTDKKNNLTRLAAVLDQQSPLTLLQRGYTVLTGPDKKPITSVKQASAGDSVTAMLADGELSLTVT
jgi:exodeoxyribonuclease VII large subunit